MRDRVMLELDEVVKRYHDGAEEVCALDRVSLRLDAGEMLALHGPSGSGKTTLLLTIAALVRPEEGSVRFDGRELTRLSEGEAADYLHREVGFVYQSPQLMPRVSALENAAMKLLLGGMSAEEAQARARPWLEHVGLSDKLRRTPERLSSGERQRVAIARALAGEPRLILADEPTGNLDSVRGAEIVRLLHEAAHERGAAVLLVTHDLEVAAIADRDVTLRDGRLTGERRRIDVEGASGERADTQPVPGEGADTESASGESAASAGAEDRGRERDPSAGQPRSQPETTSVVERR